MATIRELKEKLRATKSIEKVTSAMKQVSATRLARSQKRLLASREYLEGMRSIIEEICRSDYGEQLIAPHPLVRPREGSKKIALLVVTTNKGLCGALNSNVIRAARSAANEAREMGKRVSILVTGKKGQILQDRESISSPIMLIYRDIVANINLENVHNLGKILIDSYLAGDYDEVSIVYTAFLSATRQEVRKRTLLPLNFPVSHEIFGYSYFEPDAKSFVDAILPQFATIQLWNALLEAEASEYGARVMAMDSATNNASEVIDKLTLEYNEARQNKITKEIIDIASGAEALQY
ncbi:MAG: ATP synthase F1 subunit gamma [bacterium]